MLPVWRLKAPHCNTMSPCMLEWMTNAAKTLRWQARGCWHWLQQNVQDCLVAKYWWWFLIRFLFLKCESMYIYIYIYIYIWLEIGLFGPRPSGNPGQNKPSWSNQFVWQIVFDIFLSLFLSQVRQRFVEGAVGILWEPRSMYFLRCTDRSKMWS